MEKARYKGYEPAAADRGGESSRDPWTPARRGFETNRA